MLRNGAQVLPGTGTRLYSSSVRLGTPRHSAVSQNAPLNQSAPLNQHQGWQGAIAAQETSPTNGFPGPPTAGAAAGASTVSPEVLLQQMQQQQISLLQQQVTVLTQLLQQSQQQKVALATQVQQMNQELSSIRQQMQQQQLLLFQQQQQPATQQQQPAPSMPEESPAVLVKQLPQQQQQQQHDQQQQEEQHPQPPPQQEEEDGKERTQPAQAPTHTTVQQAAQQQQDFIADPAIHEQLQLPMPLQQQQQPEAQNAAWTEQHFVEMDHGQHLQPQTGEEAAEQRVQQEQQQQQHDLQEQQQEVGTEIPLVTAADAGINSTTGSSSSSSSDSRIAVGSAAAAPADQQQQQQQQQQQKEGLRPDDDRYTSLLMSGKGLKGLTAVYEDSAHKLEPWHLVLTLKRLTDYIHKSSISGSATSGNRNSASEGTTELALRILSQLLNHPSLWPAAAAAAETPVAATSPGSSLYPGEIQTLVASAASLPFKLPGQCMPALQQLAAAAAAVDQASSDTCLQPAQQVQLAGSCLQLGIQLPQQQLLPLLSGLSAEDILSSGDVVTCSMIVFAASALLPPQASLAAAAAAGGVDPTVLGAAMQRLGGAGSLLNRHCGARRIKSLLIQPIITLNQYQQQQLPPDRSAAEAFPGSIASVCDAVQFAITAGLQAGKQQQQQRGASSRLTTNAKPWPSRPGTSGAVSRSHQVITGGWSVVDAVVVLLTMTAQLRCQVRPGTLSVLAAAARQQLELLPDQTLVPLAQMIQQQAAAAAVTATPDADVAAVDDRHQRHPTPQYAMLRWRHALLKHFENSRGRLPFDELVAGIVALALHHTTETAAAAAAAAAASAAVSKGSSKNSSSSSSRKFLVECDCVLSDAAQWQLQAVTAAGNSSGGGSSSSGVTGYYSYSQQQLAQLIPQLVPAGLQPSSECSTALLLLLLVAPQQQQHRRPGDTVTAADLATALNAVAGLPNKPEQRVIQQLAAALQQGLAAAASSSSSSGRSDRGTYATAVEACALITALHPVQAASSSGSSSSVNMSRLGDLCYTLYQGIDTVSGNALSGFLTTIANINIPLHRPLGARAVTDSKAGVTYGAVVAAAAAAAAVPDTLSTTSLQAVVGILVAIHMMVDGAIPQQQQQRELLLGQLDSSWQQQLLGRLQGSLSKLAPDLLRQLLSAVAGLQMMPDETWLNEACQAALKHYNNPESDARSAPATLLQQQTEAAAAVARLINCAAALAAVGCQLPLNYQQAIINAVDQQVLLPYLSHSSSSSSRSSRATAVLLADAGSVVAAAAAGSSSSSSSDGTSQFSDDQLKRFADVLLRVVPAADGDCCCRLAAAAAGLGCQLGGAGVRELQKQIESTLPGTSANSIMVAVNAIMQLGVKPSPLLANALVIKTQQQLAGNPATSQLAGNSATSHPLKEACRTAQGIMSCGLAADLLAGAAWGLATAGTRLPPTWCAAVVQHLAAVAHELPVEQLYQTAYAAGTWGIKPVPQPLLQGVLHGRYLETTSSSGLGQEQLRVLAAMLVSAGQQVPEGLAQYAPQQSAAAGAGHTKGVLARSEAAAAVSTLQQQLRQFAEQQTIDTAAVLTAALVLKQQEPGDLLPLVKSPDVWVLLLQDAALLATAGEADVPSSQTETEVVDIAADVISHPDVAAVLANAGAAVQGVPAETARGSTSGPSAGPDNLAAFMQLGLTVRTEWLDHLVADMDRSALTKNSWFKQASLQSTLQYLQALQRFNIQLSLPQLEAIAKFGPRAMHEQGPEAAVLLVQLLQCLAAAVQQQDASGVAPVGQQRQKQLRQANFVQQIVTAAVPIVLEAVAQGRLQQQSVWDFISSLGSLDRHILQCCPTASSSSSTKSGMQLSSAAAAVSVDSRLLLLHAALAPTAATSGQARLCGTGLLGCMQLAASLPPAQQTPGLCQQLLLLCQHEVAAVDRLPSATAAALFCAAVSMALVAHPDLKLGVSLPTPELGGCLQQLLQDAELDWGAVAAADLVAAPKQAAAIGLELCEPYDYLAAVYQQLQQLAQIVGPTPSVITDTSSYGHGPVQLLESAVFVVMNTQRAELGNSTWQGLQQYVLHGDSDGSDSTLPEGTPVLPHELFDMVTKAVDPTVNSLSVPVIADLVHMFILSGEGTLACAWVGPAMARLWQPKSLAQLSPKQLQALVVCVEQNVAGDNEPNHKVLVNLLDACQHSLSSWSPVMITFTIFDVGRMLHKWPTELHQDLMAAVSSWQQAAVAALQPHLEQLPAECLVNLLLGNHRITERLAQNAEQSGSLGADIGAVAAGAAAAGVLAAVVAAAVTRIGDLSSGQLCDLLRALSGVTGVRGTVASEIMGKLQPHLRVMPFNVQVSVLAAYASWPDDRRPCMTQQWAQDFLSATEHHIKEAVPVTVSTQQQGPQDDTPTEAATPWPPSVFIDLAYGIPFLSELPSRAWQSQFMLAVTGHFASFNEAEAAEMLNAMALWKAAVMTSAMPGSLHSRSNSNLAHSQANRADQQTANMPISLIEGFLMVIASSGGLHPAGSLKTGKLGVLAMAQLPAGLRVLDWPVNPQVAGTCLQHVIEYESVMQDSRAKAASALDKCQQMLAESNQPQQQQQQQPKKGKKGRAAGKTEQLTGQQRQQLQNDIGLLQGMLKQADGMLSQLQVVAEDWQQLLAEGQSSAGGASSMLGRGMQDESLVQGATGLDIDRLMGGMILAAGMPGVPIEAGAGATDYGARFDSAASAGLEMDGILGALEVAGMMAEQQGYEAAVQMQHDEGYIDTTAVDIVEQ